MNAWTELNTIWRACFEQAHTAYLQAGSIPIGAVVVDASGSVIAAGGNRGARGRLLHAEMNALAALPDSIERTRCELFCTLEPCPMCTGAIRMCQLRAVHFAARDPAAGCTELLDANEFMRSFPCARHAPEDPVLEYVSGALMIEFRARNGQSRWQEQWKRYLPAAVEGGLELVQRGAYAEWLQRGISAAELFDAVAQLRAGG